MKFFNLIFIITSFIFLQACSIKESNRIADAIFAPGGALETYQKTLADFDSLGKDYNSNSSDNDWDWDYQPGNNQWVCRGINTGQYSAVENCTYDVIDDDRWPS